MSEVIFHSPDDFVVCRSLVLEMARLHADRALHRSMHRWRELRAVEGEQVAPLGECEHWQAVTRAEATIRRQCFLLLRQGWQFVCSVAPSEAGGLRHLADHHAGLSERLEQALRPLIRDRRGMDGGFVLAEAEEAVEGLLGDLRAAEAICRADLARNQSEETPSEPAAAGGKRRLIQDAVLEIMRQGGKCPTISELRKQLAGRGVQAAPSTIDDAVKADPVLSVWQGKRRKARKSASVQTRRLSVVDLDRTRSRTEPDPAELAAEKERAQAVGTLSRLIQEYRGAGGGARRAEIFEAVFEGMPRLRSERPGVRAALEGSQPAEQAAQTVLALAEDQD